MRVKGCKQTKVSSIRLRIACLQVIMYGEITVHRYIGLLLEISLLLGVWSCPSSISVEFIRVLHKYFSPFTFKTCQDCIPHPNIVRCEPVVCFNQGNESIRRMDYLSPQETKCNIYLEYFICLHLNFIIHRRK